MSDRSHNSAVFYADTLPKRTPNHQLTFRFKSAEINITKSLYELLGGGECQRVAFVLHKGAWYISRSNHPNAYNLVISRVPKFGVDSVTVNSRSFTRHIRQLWEYDPTAVVLVPVVTFATSADDLNLNPDDHPFPFYRLVTDQKKLKK